MFAQSNNLFDKVHIEILVVLQCTCVVTSLLILEVKYLAVYTHNIKLKQVDLISH